jgi:hypothetical protein
MGPLRFRAGEPRDYIGAPDTANYLQAAFGRPSLFGFAVYRHKALRLGLLAGSQNPLSPVRRNQCKTVRGIISSVEFPVCFTPSLMS